MDAIRPLNPPACRRVLWILLVRSCTVCFVFGLCLDFPLARIFASSNLNPPPLSPLHHPRHAFHLSFQPLFTDMIRFQLKPRFTQNPCFVSPLRVFPLRLSLQCAGFDSAHASRNMRMFFFVLPFPLWCSRSVCSVILTPSTFLYLTQVACQSTCFCANTIYTRNLSMFGLFQKPWFTHCFGLNSNPGLRCFV